MTPNELRERLAQPERLRAIAQAIRAKIPARDVPDLVQSTLADALVASDPPSEEAAFDRWLFGIARHKVADYFRRDRRREVLDDGEMVQKASNEAGPESARDLLRWVDRELPKEGEATRTLEWMMREASGDRLEAIAEEHAMPAPAVRQRVSRLRRYLRERWALQLAAALGLLVVVTGLFAYHHRRGAVTIVPDVARVEPTPIERGRELRERALADCRAERYENCLDELERAKALDPTGDDSVEVRSARSGATRALGREVPESAPAGSGQSTPSSEPLERKAPTTPAPNRTKVPAPKFEQQKQLPTRQLQQQTSAPEWQQQMPAPPPDVQQQTQNAKSNLDPSLIQQVPQKTKATKPLPNRLDSKKSSSNRFDLEGK